MATRVKLLPEGVREVLRSEGGLADLTGRMESARDAVKSSLGGEDAANIDKWLHVETDVGPNRVQVRLIAGDYFAMVREARTGALSRALDACGGRRA